MTLEVPRADVPGAAQLQPAIHRLIDNIERVILGKREAVTLTVVGLLAEGHVLLEDVPGTGKTTLAQALAKSTDLAFQRIQFTSDLLPSDVLGLSTHDPRTGNFTFHPGPIFNPIILADELNRTPPRTQSALLEAMNAGHVSIEGQTRDLDRPFLVIATQNPLEFEGTYPLPESQLDRFLLRIRLGYPTPEVERDVLRSQTQGHPLDRLDSVVDSAAVMQMITASKRVRIDDSLIDYLLRLIEATRTTEELLLGASTRAALGMQRAMQALALIEGRDYCVPDDLKRLAAPVLAHRVVTRDTGDLDDPGAPHLAEGVLRDLMDSIPVPE